MISLTACGYTALIDDRHGGNCLRLHRFGADALRTPEDETARERAPFFYGTPILFFPNRISSGRFAFGGREYALPVNEPETGCFIHGVMHETAFGIVRTEKDGASLLRRFTKEEGYLTFPHAFSVLLEYSLTEEGLALSVTVTNDSDTDMPAALGFHTAFRLPFSPRSDAGSVSLRLDAAAEYPRDPKTHLPDGTELTGNKDMAALRAGTFVPAARPVSALYKMGNDKEMTLTDPGSGVRVKYAAKRGYRYWMVFSPSPDFICVEPQSWLTDCPNGPLSREKTGFDFIAPGEKRIYETRMTIEKL